MAVRDGVFPSDSLISNFDYYPILSLNTTGINLTGVDPNLKYNNNELSVETLKINTLLNMNYNNIINMNIPSTNTNFLSSILYDDINKNWYYKKACYGQFYSLQNQNIDAIGTASFTKFTYTNSSNNINCQIENTTQIKVSISGMYKVTISPNLSSTAGNLNVEFWLLKNGNNVTDSNSKIHIKSNEPSLPFVEIFIDLNTNDYIEWGAVASAVGSLVGYSPAGTNPTRPAIPSVITNIQLIN